MAKDCTRIFDNLRLVREGTSQDGRFLPALDPAAVPVDGRTVADDIAFARDYAGLLNYFDKNDALTSDWIDYFSSDVSVPLAIAAIENVGLYRTATLSWFDYLDDLSNASRTQKLRDNLGYLFGAAGSLAQAIDQLAQTLPDEIALKGIIRNLVTTQLAPAMRRLIGYYRGGEQLTLVNEVAPSPQLLILRTEAPSFADTLAAGLSEDWTGGQSWNAWLAGIPADVSVYGPAGTIFTQINHCATHNLFRSVFDQFLRSYSRIIDEAKQALDATFDNWDNHAPHYALFLSFLHLLDLSRQTGNRLTGRHLDFYYRTILGLQEKPAVPGRVHLLAELAKQAETFAFGPDMLFRAGKDTSGKDAFYATTSNMVANKAKVVELKSLYRHQGEAVSGSPMHQGRLFASPAANSGDGIGGPILSPDMAWHPFFNKVFSDGELAEIAMTMPDIGFAIASHQFLMAEGPRLIELTISVSGYTGPVSGAEFKDDFRCLVTTEKGWLEIAVQEFVPVSSSSLFLYVQLSGADPAVVPYSQKVHGGNYRTKLPIVKLVFRQDETRTYAYSAFETVSVLALDISVYAGAVRTLAVSNDFGPVDTSKPFQPFGAIPTAGSSLTIGSKEIFQKPLSFLRINIDWQTAPVVYPASATMPSVGYEFLNSGQWSPTTNPDVPSNGQSFEPEHELDKLVVDAPDFTRNEFYGTRSTHGYLRLKLRSDFGLKQHQIDLVDYLTNPDENSNPGSPPVAPVAAAVTAEYYAQASLDLSTAATGAFEARKGQFFHVTPFGEAEQHPSLSGGAATSLFPQFAFVRDNINWPSEAEFYIGISALAPPQDLSLLFQVVDGTANPLAEKPNPHIHWSFLADDRWIAFESTAVADSSGELLNAGIVRLSVPREATADNTLMTGGLYWVRAAVHERSDAVCRLQLVAAQALDAGFTDRGNAPGFGATPLPAGTIAKLVEPSSAVKGISQPFASFGGRGAEDSDDFYRRISERLRHKDRAIAIWDHERLILEAFPQIYKIKCLNHTRYEPSDTGTGIYNELAAGHVTMVAIPHLQGQALRDPLKPYTALGLLTEIEAFVARRNSCFAQLHVRNPQFEEIRLVFSVRLRSGFDRSHSVKELRAAITRFLSPWAYGGPPPSFGGKIYKSVLIDFIEDQPSVDYITDLRLYRDINGIEGTTDLDEVKGSLAVSILVSAPASSHGITIIEPAASVAAAENCGCAP